MALAYKMTPSSTASPVVTGEWSIAPVDQSGEMAADSDGATAFSTLLSSAAMTIFEKAAG